jgi:hypothetical protein
MPSDPMTISGLSKEARDAVKAAFDALSTWRIEVTDNNEKHSKRVIERIAAAAAALGWPEQVVDAARTQMRSVTEMQIKTIDGIMNTWDAQLKSPSTTSSSTTPSGTKPFSASHATSSSLNGDIIQMTAMAPYQFWMGLAEQWQKPWTETMAYWAKFSKPIDSKGPRGFGT